MARIAKDTRVLPKEEEKQLGRQGNPNERATGIRDHIPSSGSTNFPPHFTDKSENKSTKELKAKGKEDFSEEEEGVYQLNPKQKLQVLGIIAASFFLFGMLLFPYQKLARYFFFNFANQISLNTGQVELNFLGSSFIDDISLSFGEGGGAYARQLRLDIPLLELIGSTIDGNMQFKELDYFSEALALSARELLLSLNIDEPSKPANQWQGNMNIEAKGF